MDSLGVTKAHGFSVRHVPYNRLRGKSVWSLLSSANSQEPITAPALIPNCELSAD